MIEQPSDSLQLLGAFQLVHGEEVVHLAQLRLQELVALLAMHPDEPLTRIQLANYFWSDSSEQQARTNVRNLLYRLKRTWTTLDTVITIERGHVVWQSDAAIRVDVRRFVDLQTDASQCDTIDVRARLLAEAAGWYGGDLLPDCYSDWILPVREQLRAHYAGGLEALIDTLITLRRYDDALQSAQTLLAHDPLRESTYRHLMQIHAVLGNRAAALHVYQRCATILRQELGVEPAPATQELRNQLRQAVPATHQPAEPAKVVQRPRMIGRHAEWQELLEAWRVAKGGDARWVIIWGEAGIGKTRLAEELIDWVKHHGYAWASSRSYAAAGALVYAPVTEWLRAPSILPHLHAIEDLWRVEIARLLPEILAERPDLPAPGPLQETWQQQRFFQAIVHALQVIPGPCLLHLDDMQWSGAETVELLHFLLHNRREQPLLFVGGIRTEDAGHNSTLSATLATLRRTGQLMEFHLGPLSQEETTELIAQSAEGEAIAPESASALFATSEGHPLFLIETLHSGLDPAPAASANAGPSKEPVQDHGKAEIPAKIYTLLAARIAQLSRTAQEVAGAAAVIGRVFDYPVLQETLALDEMTLVDALDELWARRIVREQAGDSYDFSHDRIREVAYQEISRARRRLLHRRVAVALEKIHSHALDEVAGEVAAHYAQAGDSQHAYRYYRRAANVAWENFALARAEAFFDAALELAPNDPAPRIELLHKQNAIFGLARNMQRWQKNVEQQESLLASLSTPEPRLQFLAYRDLSEYYRSAGELQRALSAAQVAVRSAEALGDTSMLAQGYQELGDTYWLLTRISDAGKAFVQSAHYARETGDLALEARSLELQSHVGMFSGMAAERLYDLVHRAFQSAQLVGDKKRMCTITSKLGYIRLSQGMGNFDQLEQGNQRGILLAREVGDRDTEEQILAYSCVAFTQKGDYRQSLEAYHASRQVGQGQSEWRHALSRHYIGLLMMQMGELDTARTELIGASQWFRDYGSRHFEVKVRCDLGLLYHLSGEDELAQEGLTEMLDLVQGYGDLRYEALSSVRLGYVLEALQQHDEARTRYERGQSLHNQMGQYYYALNALAGLARLDAAGRKETAALAQVRTIWETIRGQSTDATIETARTLRTCYSIFRYHEDPQADEVLATACAQLQRRAQTIDDPQTRSKFWQIPDHRFFQELPASTR